MTEAEVLVEQEALNLTPLHEILAEEKREEGAVIPVRQKAPDICGWLHS
jgi:hypothetical protein